MSTSSATNIDPEAVEQSVLEIVSTETEEVVVTTGPRRISGLIFHSAQAENEARSARVYGKKTDANGR